MSVIYRVKGNVASITLNRPDVLNAIDADLLQGLRDALVRSKAETSVRAVIFSGAGRAFCAGADLNQPHMAETRRKGSQRSCKGGSLSFWAANLETPSDFPVP